MTPVHCVERELLLHAGALRSLARDLVGAAHADDLVQETALRALRSPPPVPEGLFRWLATILRNLASKHRRGERRRAARAQRAAAPDAQPPAEALLERRETLRRVTDAVLALPEPYQGALLRRYFEDRSPTAIAAATGVPLATVKSRLSRGLALLRAELDRRSSGDDWRAALMGLVGLRAPAAALTLTTGTLLMAPVTKVVLGAAALGALAWLSLDALVPVPLPPHRELAAGSGAASVVAEPSAEASAAGREAVAGAPPPRVDLAHPFAFELVCRVVDRDGLPVEGAEVLLAPRGAALVAWPETTSADGAVALRWRGKRASMAVAVGVRRGLAGEALQEIALAAGAARRVVLLGEARLGAHYLRTRALAERATLDLGDARLETTSTEACRREQSNAGECRSCHAGPAIRTPFDSGLRFVDALHPESRLADRLIARSRPAAAEPALGAMGGLLANEVVMQLSHHRASAVTVMVDALRVSAKGDRAAAADTGELAGVVYGADGAPADNVTVVWGTAWHDPAHRTRTRDGGRFRFEGVPFGLTPVRAGGGDAGLAQTAVEVAPAGPAPAALHLHQGARIRGRAVGADGAPLAAWRIEYAAADRSWRDLATVRDDGSFVLPNLPGGPAQLLLRPKGGGLPAAIEPSVLPDSGEVVFDLRRGKANGSLRVLAALPGELEHCTAEARAWQQDSGRGASMQPAKDGAFVLAGLPAGFYRIEIGGESFGWVDLGAQWVDGEGCTDLGRRDLPRPGRLRLLAADPEQPVELWLRRRDVDARAEDAAAVAAARNGGELLLPAGEWCALWRRCDGGLGAAAFAVRAGALAEVRCGDQLPAGR